MLVVCNPWQVHSELWKDMRAKCSWSVAACQHHCTIMSEFKILLMCFFCSNYQRAVILLNDLLRRCSFFQKCPIASLLWIGAEAKGQGLRFAASYRKEGRELQFMFQKGNLLSSPAANLFGCRNGRMRKNKKRSVRCYTFPELL